MSIGSNVKELREARGLSQSALARLSHMPPASLSRLESGVIKEIRTGRLARLAGSLNVSTDRLMGRGQSVRGPIVSDLVLRTREAPTVAELTAGIKDSLNTYGWTASEVAVSIQQQQDVGGYTTAINFKHQKGNAKEQDRPNVLDAVVTKALASPLHGCDRLACDLHADGIRLSASAVRRRLVAVGLSTREQRAEHLKREADAGNIVLSGEQKAAMRKIFAAETKKKEMDGDSGKC